MPDIYISKEEKTKQVKKEVDEVKSEIKTSHSKKKSLEKAKKALKAIKKPSIRNNKPLAAFCYYPERANFVNQDPGEEIILVLRKHWITNIPWIFMGTLMLFAPAALSIFPVLEFLPGRFQFIAVVIWYMITVAYVFEQFLSWFFNVNIITDERVIDVDFVNLIYREMTDANIDKVQDVTVKLGSAIRTLFNYGDIAIQTASEIPQIGFEAIPQPDRVARILRDLRIQEEIEKIEGRVR